MHSLDAIINESKDVREVKRALSVKMGLHGIAPTHICQVLNVSPQYVSKWKVQYEATGAGALLLSYRGSESYLSAEQRGEVERWIKAHETLTVEQVRNYLEEQYGVVYQSKQSYYNLLEAGGMSYHQSEKVNPKRDEAQVRERREAIKKNWRRTVPR